MWQFSTTPSEPFYDFLMTVRLDSMVALVALMRAVNITAVWLLAVTCSSCRWIYSFHQPTCCCFHCAKMKLKYPRPGGGICSQSLWNPGIDLRFHSADCPIMSKVQPSIIIHCHVLWCQALIKLNT